MEHYDLLCSTTQAYTGINIAQLLSGYSEEAKAVARRIFRGRTCTKVMAAVKSCYSSRRIVIDQNRTNDTERIRLVADIGFRTVVRALFDFGAVPNVMSADLFSVLHFEPLKTN